MFEVCLAGTFTVGTFAAPVRSLAAPLAEPPTMRTDHALPPPASIRTDAPWADRIEPSQGVLLAVVSETGAEGTQASVLQAEAELGMSLGFAGVDAVLAWDEDRMGLAAMVGAVRLLGPQDALQSSDFTLELSGGRMDVPVGLDFELYSAKDRKMVSEPLIVEHTHGGWNALGGQVSVSTDDFEVRAFGVQAFDREAADRAEAAIGGWARLRLGAGLSVGASAAVTFDREVEARAGLTELDLTYTQGGFSASAEIVALASGGEVTTGGYLLAEQTFGRLSLGARADLVQDEGALRRHFSLCTGLEVAEDTLVVRAEVGSDFGAEAETLLVQAVAML